MAPARKTGILLFALTFLVGQLSLSLHDHDLHAHEDGKQCQICLHSSGLDKAIADSANIHAFAAFEIYTFVLTGCSTQPAFFHFNQRAPPFKTLI